MLKYDPSRPLISIHIPKCGGKSFSDVLKRWFGRGYLEHYPDERRGLHPKKHNLVQDSNRMQFIPNICIHGHFNHERGNGAEKYYPNVDQYITIIRDPFEIHLSTYFFVKRREKENRGNMLWAGKKNPIIANNWGLEDFLYEHKKSYLLSFFPVNLTAENYQQILDTRYIFIGLTKNLQGSVDQLAKILGYPSPLVAERNVSDWDEPIPDSARDEFIGNNPLAMSVYEYAVKLFYKKYPASINK